MKPEFFDSAKFPKATFVSTGVKVQGTQAEITGNLTIKGITKPVTLDTEFYGAGKATAMMGGKEIVGFVATTTIKRSEERRVGNECASTCRSGGVPVH